MTTVVFCLILMALCFIRAVWLPTPEDAAYSLPGGIRTVVRSVQSALRTLPLQSPLATRHCRLSSVRHGGLCMGLRLRLQKVFKDKQRNTGLSENVQTIGIGVASLEKMKKKSMFFSSKRLLFLPVGLIRAPRQEI